MGCGKCLYFCLIKQDEEQNPFHDNDVRKKFIKIVFLILCVQLLTFFAICSLFMFYKEIHSWIKENYYLLLTVAGILIVALLLICVCNKVFRSPPYNYILLSVFTLVSSFLYSFLIALCTPEKVLYALAVSLAIDITVILLAMQRKCDFTICYVGIVLIICVVVLLLVIQVFAFPKYTTFQIVVAAIGIIVCPIWLFICVQLTMTGRWPYITPDDYATVALHLYISITLIFYMIIKLWSSIKIQ